MEYHGLRFEEEISEEPDFQGRAVVHCPDDGVPFSRIIEHKRFTGAHSPKTVITREYAGEWVPGQERYDPVKDERNEALYQQYLKLAEVYPNVTFGGRLGEHRSWTRPLPPRVKKRKN